jgi:pyruvate,orthophosphate dikinase
LQTRVAKRPAQAAVRFAVDAVGEGLLSREQAFMTIDAASLDALLHPTFAFDAHFEVLTTGVAASPGAAKGEIVFSAEEAVAWAERGHHVVLVRPFTDADDIHGFFAAVGILTAEGGKASHAALVARGMGKPCVAGAAGIRVDVERRELRVGDRVLRSHDRIAIDGSTGRVSVDDVPLAEPTVDENFETVLRWSDRLRRLGVRANADTPEDAQRAREFGAEGIGLFRTEHMFMAADRQPKMQAMILASSPEARRRALQELLPLQREDFEGLLEAMAGLPVTIRLLDPPLHEFLPNATELAVELERARTERAEDLGRLEVILERVRELEETKVLIGTMIELPGACFVANEIARVADFFRSARTTSLRRRSDSHVTTWNPDSSPTTSSSGSSTARRSRRSTRRGSGGSCVWGHGLGARHGRTYSSVSAGSTAATPRASGSSTSPARTMCPARPTESR